MKRVLMGLAVVIILGVGILWAVVQLAGRDVPPPDDAEFAAERPEVAPEDNAFTYFLQATNLLVQTTNSALQADYLAGMWAHHAQKMRDILEPGDIEEALNAANSIGDDLTKLAPS